MEREGLIGNLKMKKGFNTLEIMIAFAILAMVLTGVILANFGSQYWTITSQTSNEALYKAKTLLEDLRGISRQDFLSATSSSLRRDDASCVSGSLCYFLETKVTDISPCAKYAEANVSWEVPSYPTTTTALFTTFANSGEVVRRGGDCSQNYPSGKWDTPVLTGTPTYSGGGVGIDVEGGFSYIAESQSPFLQIFSTADTNTTYAYSSRDNAPFNAIDVARDLATGRTYAYLASASSTQFQVVDATDPSGVFLSASRSLSGVSTTTPATHVFFYNRYAYLTTAFATGPEFHVFDVGYPATPTEKGSKELGTSVYDMTVRDQYSVTKGSTRSVAYLAVGNNNPRELMVLDVTDPKNIGDPIICDLSGSYKGSALFVQGNVLYFGKDQVPSGSPDLFAYDITDPFNPNFCSQTPLVGVDVDDAGFSMHVTSIRASGPYLFVGANNTTGSHGEIQIRSADPATGFSLLGTYSVPKLVDYGIEFDGDTNQLNVLSNSPNQMQILRSTPE